MASADVVDDVSILVEFTAPRGVPHRHSKTQILMSVFQAHQRGENKRGLLHDAIEAMESDGYICSISGRALDGKRLSWKTVATEKFKENAKSQHDLGAAEVAIVRRQADSNID